MRQKIIRRNQAIIRAVCIRGVPRSQIQKKYNISRQRVHQIILDGLGGNVGSISHKKLSTVGNLTAK